MGLREQKGAKIQPTLLNVGAALSAVLFCHHCAINNSLVRGHRSQTARVILYPSIVFDSLRNVSSHHE